MNEKTQKYVSSRFSDFYRGNLPELPPESDSRELAYILWDDETMRRHISRQSISSLKMFLSENKPRHLYISAAIFEKPGASNMKSKNWKGSNLIFDIDAQDVPYINENDSYPEKMSKCKNEIQKLINFIEDDFGIYNYSVNFSGSKGFHLRVRDENVLNLSSKERIEISNYLSLSKDIKLDNQLIKTANFNLPPEVKRFDPSGGWSRKLYYKTLDFFKELKTESKEDIKSKVSSYEGIGDKKADKISEKIDYILSLLKWGAIDTSDGINIILEQKLEEIKKMRTHIDQPVTTDTNRLLRVQDSLHGGQGLMAKSLSKEELSSFKPTVDSIPTTFNKRSAKIRVKEDTKIKRDDKDYVFSEGDEVDIIEHVAISLICKGKAEKL